MSTALRRTSLHLRTELPEEFKQEFFQQLHLHNLRRINLFCWVIGIIFSLLLLVDYLRFQERDLYQGDLYIYLLVLHCCAFLYFSIALFIKFKRKDLYSGRIDPKFIVYIVVVLFALSGPPQDILTFQEQGKVILYLTLILLINWALNLPHQFRLISTLSSFVLMTATIIMVGGASLVELLISLYEVWGFTIVSFIFGTVDFNFRVKKFYSEKLLEQEKKKIEELEKFKSTLYMNLTHEFRTPLTVINGMTDLFREYYKAGAEEELEKALATIYRNSDNLLRLVNQLLELAKLESKTIQLDIQQKDILGFTKSLVESFGPYAKKKNIDLKLNSAVSAFYMDFDEEKMYSILSNLLSNALKFTPKGGTITVHILTTTASKTEWLSINIVDTGHGINQKHIPHIFDLFYRVEDEAIQNTSGTGIGLALTKRLVELMNGRISVESQLERGTTFQLKFKVTRNTPKSKLAVPLFFSQDNNSPVVTTSLKNLNTDLPILLLVEDDEELLQYMTSLLQAHYIIEIARDGEEGKQKAIELIPDFIISDVRMPKKDGFTFCKEIKQEEKTEHIPIILLTAKAEIQDRLEGLESGADAYLTKPFNKEELFIRLEKLRELRIKLQKKYNPFQVVVSSNTINQENTLLSRLNRLIEANIDNVELSVEDLAKGLFMSRMQLHRKLKATANRSTSNYLRSFRLHKSKVLLNDPRKKIAEVALAVGFQDPGYFSKVFFKEFGKTPTEYREA